MSARKPTGMLERAVFALLGQLGFYGLGGALALGLLAIPWGQARYQGGPDPLGLLAIPLAGLVLWAMLPPLKAQEIHGLLLHREDQPRLFALLDRVSAQVGAPLPEEVWLIPEANAFIGRVGALRRRRRLGIGYGILHILEEDELASVIGHELGHALGGDVALGPWVLGTRNAIHTALRRLDAEGAGLHLPFQLYGRWYLRASLSVSRAQELAADAVAGRVAGPEIAGRALQRIHDRGPLWEVYWRQELVPLLERGRLPPIDEGFARFLGAAPIETLAAGLAERERAAQTEADDSHPALPERLQSLGASVAPPPALREPAVRLLDGAPERPLIQALMSNPIQIQALRWEDVGESLRVPILRGELEPYRAVLAPVSAASLVDIVSRPEPWLERVRPPGPQLLSEQAQTKRLITILGAHLTLLLARRGFRVIDLPGEPIAAVRGEERVEPFLEVVRLQEDAAARAAWKARAATWEAPPSTPT